MLILSDQTDMPAGDQIICYLSCNVRINKGELKQTKKMLLIWLLSIWNILLITCVLRVCSLSCSTDYGVRRCGCGFPNQYDHCRLGVQRTAAIYQWLSCLGSLSCTCCYAVWTVTVTQCNGVVHSLMEGGQVWHQLVSPSVVRLWHWSRSFGV